MEPTLGDWGRLHCSRISGGKKSGDGSTHDREVFNALIGDVQLMDLPFIDRSFTWSNMRDQTRQQNWIGYLYC